MCSSCCSCPTGITGGGYKLFDESFYSFAYLRMCSEWLKRNVGPARVELAQHVLNLNDEVDSKVNNSDVRGPKGYLCPSNVVDKDPEGS